MKSRPNIFYGLFALVLVLSFSARLGAATMGTSHGHDLDQLWASAQKQYDLEAYDAVLLLEGRHVSILENGNLRTRVHRVVWIGTEQGIDHHADLRIPWNSATSTLKVVALRTWRDGRWWPHELEVSETAVVETLPFALALADDYTSMRETMLLHDGVELPCIMETIYEIEEQGVAADGSDALFVFPQNDPALLVECRLTVPEGIAPKYRSGNGAPEPVTASDDDETTLYTWSMESVDRLGTPHTECPAVYEPHIIWSTWNSWEALGEKVRSNFHAASVQNVACIDSLLSERQEYEPSKDALIHGIAGFVSEGTRSVDYDSRFWRYSPRPAARTWETGYGHALDRAVLAAALFGRLGFSASIVFRTAPLAKLDQDMPTLAAFEGFAVRVRGHDADRVYDPLSSRCEHIYSWMHGATVWEPGGETEFFGQSAEESVMPGTTGECTIDLELEPADEGNWKGTGYFRSRFGLSHYDDITGIDDKARGFVEENVRSVLPGAGVKAYNPEKLLPDDVAFGFDLEMAVPESDAQDRITFVIGAPQAGIEGKLPGDLHLYDEHRSSPVLLNGKLAQHIRLRLKAGDREIVYLPEPYELKNETGSFYVTVEKDGDWIAIDRKLQLNGIILQPEAWPFLRALLLEEQDPIHRTVILK